MTQTAEATTVARDAESRLRRMILDMEIGPGERMTERWIEGQLGASRTSVRAALFRLEAEGLVAREGRGWIVPAIDLVEVGQLFDYREVLETASLRMLAGPLDASQSRQADALLEAAGLPAPDGDHEDAGYRFHLWIAELSGNAFIKRGMADAMVRLQRVRWLESDADHHGWEEHRAVVAALREGRNEEAAILIAKHTHASRDRLLAELHNGRRSLRARGALVR